MNNIEKLILELNEKHSSLLSEYSKGNANKEVMKLYRSRMKDILGFINVLESLNKISTKKTVVRVALNRKAVEIFEEDGWDALVKAKEDGVEDLQFTEKYFNTPLEATAYLKGFSDAYGWDEPFAVIVDNKIEG